MKPFITTFTGRKVNPLDLKPEDIDIRDIAHALAQCNRFAGHARRPISVAYHSVWVSRLAEPYGLAGLLHDASEAYLGDVTRWLKQSPEMEAYRMAEDVAQATIYTKFNCLPPDLTSITWADDILVRFEYEMAYCEAPEFFHGALSKPTRRLLDGWQFVTWEEAESLFLMRFADLKR